jgi:hypothetical protein
MRGDRGCFFNVLTMRCLRVLKAGTRMRVNTVTSPTTTSHNRLAEPDIWYNGAHTKEKARFLRFE